MDSQTVPLPPDVNVLFWTSAKDSSELKEAAKVINFLDCYYI